MVSLTNIPVFLSSFLRPAQSQESPEPSRWRCILNGEVVSKYLWRSAVMHDGPAIQTGLEFTWDQWTAGL